MEWEPVFILGVMGGAMLVSALRGVIDTERRGRPAAVRPAAARRRAAPTAPAAAAPPECSPEIGALKDRVAMLEWLAVPAARAASENGRLRRGAA